jgi:enoyl-CoA hydratase/carnithine racemase
MTDTILYRCNGAVSSIVLNNPNRHNALGRQQLEVIQAHLTQVAADRQVRALVITGVGEKTFCAGASLNELSAGQISDEAFQKMTGQLAGLPLPTICAMNGDVFGGGVELAASCDFRIGVHGSRMRVPAAALGLCYPLSGIRRLVECLGISAAKRVLVAAEEFDAHSMMGIGFLDHLVEPQDLDEFAQLFAQRIAALAPMAVQAMKHILRQAASGTVDAEEAQRLSTLCLESTDLQEGFAAKREKRTPLFEGR